jgi:hypothetical protein
MKLIPNWTKLYKAWSVWCMVAVFAVLSLPDLLPQVAAYLPAEWARWFALAGIVARAIKQGINDVDATK